MASPPPRGDGSGFRPDLEGLRAVAVVLVLLYHAGVPGIRGGYVGVDVFFVLSGFLITGLLIRELSSSGRISLSQFYARRARRLLPASAVVLGVTAVASAIMLPPLRMPDVTGDIVAAAAYVSNLRFAAQATDYLASELAPSPVLHFWSLGVEEQFYLFWPALLALVAGVAFARGDVAGGVRRVAVTLGVVFVGSLGLSLWLTTVQQPWAFFSLPTRAWELALGGIIAIPLVGRWIPRTLSPLMAWAGLALVLYAGVAFSSSTPFPGLAALVPTVGSALVIAAGLRRDAPAAPDGVRPALPGPGPLLALPPVRFLGRISYSLYLWHWPILVLPAAAFGPQPGPVRLALAGLAIVVAAASQRWVEEPIRHGRFVGVRPSRNLALAGLTTVVVVVGAIGVGAWTQRGLTPTGPAVGGSIDEVPLPSEATATTPPGSGAPPSDGPAPQPSYPPLVAGAVPADLAPTLRLARDDLPVIYDDDCHLSPAAVEIPDCAFGATDSSTTVVLFGDSHAAQWFPAFERLATERGWRLVSLTKSACASADVDVWSGLYNRRYDECAAWRELAFKRIEQERPALVIVSNARRYTLTLDGAAVYSTDHEDLWSEGLQRTVQRLRPAASEVVIIGDTVRMTDDPPVCLSTNLDNIAACAAPRAGAVATRRLAEDARVAAASGATFVDPTPWQCFTDPCPPVVSRFLVYRDTHHMTATYARALASRLFAALPTVAVRRTGAAQ